VITPKGVAAAIALSDEPIHNSLIFSAMVRSSKNSHENWASPMPIWDEARRVLSLDGRIVKQFKWRAVNQELILSVFQEDGWPVRIDDPLAPLLSLVTKRRLNDTIKCLNRKQTNNLIRFRGDGTGLGVIWESTRRSTAG
jgi:hypothetical protein